MTECDLAGIKLCAQVFLIPLNFGGPEIRLGGRFTEVTHSSFLDGLEGTHIQQELDETVLSFPDSGFTSFPVSG